MLCLQTVEDDHIEVITLHIKTETIFLNEFLCIARLGYISKGSYPFLLSAIQVEGFPPVHYSGADQGFFITDLS